MQSRKIATCGVLCALAIVILMLGSLIRIGTYAAPMIAIWLLLPILGLFGRRASLTAYFAVALLGLIVLPDRELALFYCAFGWWPAAKPAIDRIPGGALSGTAAGKTLRFLVKLLIYLVLILLIMYLVYSVLGIEKTEDIAVKIYWIPGVPIPFTVIDFAVIALGAVMFFYCDLSMGKMTDLFTAKAVKLMKIH